MGQSIDCKCDYMKHHEMGRLIILGDGTYRLSQVSLQRRVRGILVRYSHRRSFEDAGLEDWNNSKEKEEILAATRSQEGQGADSLLAPPEGAWPCEHLVFRLLASRAVRKQISVVNHQVCGSLLQHPEEINISWFLYLWFLLLVTYFYETFLRLPLSCSL